MDKAKKIEEYINLCTPSFLIKMKTKNDKSYFFKAHPSGTDKYPAYNDGIFRFIIADIDDVGDEDVRNYREINLNNEFNDLESLKAVIIPEHKDMYKDIVTDGMKVDCGKDNCGGDALKKEDVIPNVPQGTKKKSSLPTGPINLTPGMAPLIKSREQAGHIYEREKGNLFKPKEEPKEGMGGHGKKKKKRRKKSSRSKKRRNKRNNRTKKN